MRVYTVYTPIVVTGGGGRWLRLLAISPAGFPSVFCAHSSRKCRVVGVGAEIGEYELPRSGLGAFARKKSGFCPQLPAKIEGWSVGMNEHVIYKGVL